MTEQLKDLCKEIAMPLEVTGRILTLDKECEYSEIQEWTDKLFHQASWKEGLAGLKKILDPDPDGLKMLTCMLRLSQNSHLEYKEKGIRDEIFYDTMACFSRFVEENRVSYGRYGFNREWWTTRQLSLTEFRLGTLEFEMAEMEGEEVISIHIPSDAHMNTENCRDSYLAAQDFFKQYYPQYQYKHFACETWLLSPALKEIVSPDSRILEFQEGFHIVKTIPDVLDYMEWVFKNPKLSIDEVPQDTSMQRKMKAYIKAGGDIGAALGYLKEEYLDRG